ncbi:DUF4158 domain-containing protein [Bacillus sp. FSL E2-8895]|uniref:DUF4158 domain-containing protein n=1 Tax=unclassified Bacillus (in: firmicutes) TaxID=185979 RepID=UPI0030FC2906
MSSKRARELLTSEQRLEFASIPEQISEYELGSYYTLSPHDIEIIKRHRRDHNKLGFALQLCVLKFPGWTLSDVQHIPDCVVNYIAKQLQINAKEEKRKKNDKNKMGNQLMKKWFTLLTLEKRSLQLD